MGLKLDVGKVIGQIAKNEWAINLLQTQFPALVFNEMTQAFPICIIHGEDAPFNRLFAWFSKSARVIIRGNGQCLSWRELAPKNRYRKGVLCE